LRDSQATMKRGWMKPRPLSRNGQTRNAPRKLTRTVGRSPRVGSKAPVRSWQMAFR
jgi:hypothetical protein